MVFIHFTLKKIIHTVETDKYDIEYLVILKYLKQGLSLAIEFKWIIIYHKNRKITLCNVLKADESSFSLVTS